MINPFRMAHQEHPDYSRRGSIARIHAISYFSDLYSRARPPRQGAKRATTAAGVAYYTGHPASDGGREEDGMDLELKGKTALVTGASEGIGSAIARKLAGEGMRVAICARTETKLKETADRIAAATGMEIVPIPADLRTLAGCQGFVEQAAERLGGIDVLVNNAGASAFGAFVDLPDDAFVDAINGKLLGYIRCAKAVIPHMRRRGGGVIVNITGTTQQAAPLHTPGSACNAAIRMFSKELSMELGPLNIRVNSLAPGRIQTARSDRLLEATATAQGTSPEAMLGQLVKTIPSGRLGTIDDIGDAVCFLVSERATYVNGAALVVDGSKSLVI
jgi:NAD(P)-dependent dehydrogenase (short-subunit alcohol dehydrogenase family)